MKIVLNNLTVQCDGPMELFWDNKLTMNIVVIMFSMTRKKHLEIDPHFIKEKLDSGLIAATYIPSRHQLTDVLRKGFLTERFS